MRTSVTDAHVQQQQQQQPQHQAFNQQQSPSLTPTWNTSTSQNLQASGSSSSDAVASHAAWTQLISRSILFRVHPDHRPEDITSGTAICVEGIWDNNNGNNVDGRPPSLTSSSPCAEVLGFTAFAQPSSFEQDFDVDGPRLYSRLERGQIAFFRAVQVPERLKDKHVIV